MIRRLNILIVAHEFSPAQGSECAVGWNLVTNLSRHHNLTVIYAKTNQFKTSDYESSVRDYLSTGRIFQGLKLIPLPQPKTTDILVKLNTLLKSNKSAIGFAPLYYAGYKVWQKEAFKVASRLVKEQKFDIVHQLTSISFREPGYLWKLGIPFVWGPCSGLVKVPYSFYINLSLKEILFEFLRSFSNYIQSNFSYRINRATKKAAMIYTVTIDDYRYFKERAGYHIRMMLDVGTYSNLIADPSSTAEKDEKIKLLWVGRLVHTKALDILLKSLSLNIELNRQVELTIIGDGPLRVMYEGLSSQLRLMNINWMGNIPHESVLLMMQKSDVLLHTSIKEATSAVILEALTFGLPVICHDAFGMSIAVDETCGIKIPLVTPTESINGFYNAINKIVQNRMLINVLKRGALIKSRKLSWESMAETIATDYVDINKNIGTFNGQR